MENNNQSAHFVCVVRLYIPNSVENENANCETKKTEAMAKAKAKKERKISFRKVVAYSPTFIYHFQDDNVLWFCYILAFSFLLLLLFALSDFNSYFIWIFLRRSYLFLLQLFYDLYVTHFFDSISFPYSRDFIWMWISNLFCSVLFRSVYRAFYAPK